MMNSNDTAQNITLTSCEYTPIYVIQNNAVTQATSYVLAPAVHEQQRPITSSLKLFYENSGNIENNLLINSATVHTKPVITSKPASDQTGNKLKLASFLVPKPDIKTVTPSVSKVNPRVLKPTTSTNSSNPKTNFSIVSSVVTVEKDEIAKAKKNSIVSRTLLKHKAQSKAKPKEPVQKPLPKHTSFQLLKLGGTYHSLNHLSEDQMRLVNKALENIGDPEKCTPKPTFDPVTNTKINYKVVSPNDLKVVGKNKIVIKEGTKRNVKTTNVDAGESSAEPVEIKVTRSGRKVKQPKNIQEDEDCPPKIKKKTSMTCYHCSSEFSSIYRLQRHYEDEPAHIPTDVHSDLFRCLLAALGRGSDEEKCTNFIQQLQRLLEKLRTIMPCLVKTVDGKKGVPCELNEDLGRLFGMTPGKYNLNLDAINCVRDNEGYCRHNPPKPITTIFTSEVSKPSQLWLTKHQEEIASSEAEGETCARINPVDKWQVKRIWKYKIRKPEKTITSKKKRVLSEVIEPHIELGNEAQETLLLQANDNAAPFPVNLDSNELDKPISEDSFSTLFDKKNKGSHTQFHSTHFDIRSSPIKASSTVFNKFQIVPEKIPNKSDVQFLRPLLFSQEHPDQAEIANISNADSIDINGILKEFTTNHDTNPEDTNLNGKETDVDPMNGFIIHGADEQSHDSFLKSANLIEPAMLHVRDSDPVDPKNYTSGAFNVSVTDFHNATDSVANGSIVNDNHMSLNFLDSLTSDCLTCPEAELRNNAIDFQLDLFSFNHS